MDAVAKPGFEVTTESRFDSTHCPRCRHAVETRNGDGRVIETLVMMDVEGHGVVCVYCAKFIAADGTTTPRAALLKTMRGPK